MKKTLFILLICLGSFATSFAQNNSFKDDAVKLTKLSNDAVEAAFGQMYSMIPAEKLEAFKTELKPIKDNYYIKMAEISMEYYTHEDVKQLLKFYDTELGQKVLKTQTKLTERSMEMVQSLSMKMMPLLQKYSN